MPKVNHNRVQRETPYTRVTVVDPPSRSRKKTQIVQTGTQPAVERLTTRQLRSRRIEVHIVRRVPKPNINPAFPDSWSNGGRSLHRDLVDKSERESRRRYKDESWLTKLDFKQIELAFHPYLRNHNYLLHYHLRALYVTGLIDNLGPHSTFDPVGYLEGTQPGRAYLQSIANDHNLATVAEFADAEAFLLGRIYQQQTQRLEEGTYEYEDGPNWCEFCFSCWLWKRDSCRCEEDQAEVEEELNQLELESDSEPIPDSPISSASEPSVHPGQLLLESDPNLRP